MEPEDVIKWYRERIGWLRRPLFGLGLLVPFAAVALPPDVPLHHFQQQRWSATEGLPQVAVQSLMQDDKGILWVGTQSGLSLFADERLHLIDDGRDTGPIRAMASGPEPGTVWLAAESGLYLASDRGLTAHPEIRSALFSVTAGASGRLYIGGRGKLWVLDDDVAEPHRLGPENADLELRALAIDDALLIKGTSDGLRTAPLDRPADWHSSSLSGADGIELMAADTPASSLSASSLFEIDGTIWAMMQGAIVRFIGDETHFYPNGNGLRATVSSFILQDEHGYIWTTTHEGIQRFPLTQFDEFDRGQRERFSGDLFGDLTDPIVAQCNGGHGQAGPYQPEVGRAS